MCDEQVYALEQNDDFILPKRKSQRLNLMDKPIISDEKDLPISEMQTQLTTLSKAEAAELTERETNDFFLE